MEVITKFEGEYDFLDNAYNAPIIYKDRFFKCAEAAYQAERISDPLLKSMFEGMGGSEARYVGMFATERDGWDNIKYQVLYDITKEKFIQNPQLYQRLAETMDAIIDNAFLGNILMSLRTQYKAS